MQAKEVHVTRHHTTFYNEHDIAVLTLHKGRVTMFPAKACCTIIVTLTRDVDVRSENFALHNGMQTLVNFQLTDTSKMSRWGSRCTFALVIAGQE
jgi:hypothetical protein